MGAEMGRGMTTHELKTWPHEFQAMLDGKKTHEVRRNDRGYEVGDTLVLREWSPVRFRNRYGAECEPGGYTERVAYFTVDHLTPGGSFGLPPDLCVMSVRSQYACEKCGGVSISFTVDGADSKLVCERYPNCVPHPRDHAPEKE
jgi:hypothetical protein